MGCLSYCRKGPASPQFAQSAQWCKQRYCIDLIYPILLLAVLLFALLSVGLPAVSSRWLSVTAPHGLPLFIGGPPRSNFATAVLPAVYSRWCFAVPLRHQSLPDGASQRRLTVCQSSLVALPEATSQRRSCQLRLPDGALASISATVPRPATSSRQLSATVPPSSSPWRPGQQQTSSGGEKYSGLASNLAHLSRIC